MPGDEHRTTGRTAGPTESEPPAPPEAPARAAEQAHPEEPAHSGGRGRPEGQARADERAPSGERERSEGRARERSEAPPRLQRVVEDEGPLPAPQLRRVATRTAAALAAKHRAGIVHHGFHPGTVLLAPEGAKVSGFGAAPADGAAPPSGPPAYLSPEQIEDEPAGPPADVFAWGATMVFAATGRPAFGTGPGAAVMRRVTSHRPDLGDMHEPLRDLAARCLDKNPAARPTAPQIVRALREGKGPMPKPRPTRIPRYRWRMMVALAIVVAAGFALGMLF